MDPIQTNIENVTGLWTTAAMTFNGYYEEDGISFANIPESQWPNKIWLHGAPSEENLQAAATVIRQKGPELSLVYFDTRVPEALETLHHSGFKETLFLNAMSLQKPVERSIQPKDNYNSLELTRVTDQLGLREWCRAFKAAFGYTISEETLARTHQSIQYYLLRARGQTVGTLAFFWTGTTLGIYSMGIVPEARGRGYAQEAMQLALHQSAIAGAEMVVLQASAMGLPMYRKLGFTTDFTMRIYSLNT